VEEELQVLREPLDTAVLKVLVDQQDFKVLLVGLEL
jgi:hypothetical protein